MKLKALVVCACLVALAAGFLLWSNVKHRPTAVTQPAASEQAPAESVPHPQPPTRAELLSLVNQERARNGVAPLTEDPRLDTSAQMKADDEVAYGYFGHISPHDGKPGTDFIKQVGIYCRVDSENLVWDVNPMTHEEMNNTSQGAVTAWLKSPKHHAAMIDPANILTGFGINGTQVVEHFCQQ